MIANSILENDCELMADTTIKYNEVKSIFKVKIVDKRGIYASDFMQLSKAFFIDFFHS